MQELSYKKNTGYLIIAAIFAQLFGAAQKIVLSRLVGEEGMAIYQSAFCVYSLFIILSCGGIPLALSRFISEKRAEREGERIYPAIRFSFLLICAISAVLSIVMFLLGGFFGLAMKEPDARYAIAALSPAVFAVSLGALLKSCFEGFSNMRPCAVSQVLESAIKLIAVYSLTKLLCIFSAKYIALGSALAVTVGEMFATSVLLMFFIPVLKSIKGSFAVSSAEMRKYILLYALPVTLYAIILSSLDLLENAVIRNSLLAIRFSDGAAERLFTKYSRYTTVFDTIKTTRRLTLQGASWLYGAFFGYALTIIRFPAGLLRTFSVSFFPFAASCFAVKKEKDAGDALSRIIGIILCASMSLCAAITLLRKELLTAVFGSMAYSSMLLAALPLLVLSPVCSILSSTEYASGRTFAPFLFGAVSFMVSIPLCFILIKIPEINISGTAVASASGAFVELLLHILFVTRAIGLRIRLMPALLRSIACALAVYVFVSLIKTPFFAYIGNIYIALFAILAVSSVFCLLLMAYIKRGFLF